MMNDKPHSYVEDNSMLGTQPIHANFSVDNLDTAEEFYTSKLGYRGKRDAMGQLILEAGNGTKINIYEKKDHVPWNSTVLGIEVDDVGKAVDELKEKGISTAKLEGTDAEGIMKSNEAGEAAWFQDPARNWICVSNMV
jgi:catechol 2,3-dioxygenase-like lactoylglutathione lyase family enzyme